MAPIKLTVTINVMCIQQWRVDSSYIASAQHPQNTHSTLLVRSHIIHVAAAKPYLLQYRHNQHS